MPDAVLNGCQHHWEEAGSGEPMVMLHGASASGKQLAKHVPELSTTYRLLIPDMRGMGQSERVTAIPPSAWVDDVRALLDHLNVPKAHVFGVSVGGRVAQRFAIDHPDRVLSLIVDGPIVYNEPEAQEAVGNEFELSKLPEKRKEEFRSHHGEGWEEVVTNYQNIRLQPDLQQYLDLRELTKQIQAPALIMRGDRKGGGYSAEHAWMLYQNIKSAKLWIRPNSGGGLLNSVPDEVYPVVRAFTAGIAS